MIDGNYQLQIGEPYLMSEVGLGIGQHQAVIAGIQQEFLYWYDQQGKRYFTDAEQAQQERSRAEQERQRAEQLAQYLRFLGID
ncbi:hypothetical protein [Nostoc sp.]|uniref:hypothetical protein n=1 Tax=Nostoc sp. TaxID=1180 RepID=UPI002FF61847